MKTHLLVIVLFLISTALAVWGQDAAYALSRWVPIIERAMYLTGITVFSISLFSLSAIVIYLYMRTQSHVSNSTFFLFFAIVVLGGVLSVGSSLILAFWWG